MRRHKVFLFLFSLILLASFAFLLFHHHEDGQHAFHCSVCRFVQQVLWLFPMVVTLFFSLPFKGLFSEVHQKLFSVFSVFALKDRAPPVLA
ncbi:MAG: hypothetical protein HYS55_03715 [Candidatus Omnitrophica bacterium]|nr:hypothetical protein [Candidatus Omnitrophota bacterium]